MKNKKNEFTEFEVKLIKELKSQIKKTEGRCVIASIEKVSQSGMNRIISFHFVGKKYNIYQLNCLISKVCGYSRPQNYNGIAVKGCGMDMMFHVLYGFYRQIKLKDEYPQYSGNYTRV